MPGTQHYASIMPSIMPALCQKSERAMGPWRGVAPSGATEPEVQLLQWGGGYYPSELLLFNPSAFLKAHENG